MVDPSRLSRFAAVLLPALCLCSSCGSQVPDGEVPCEVASLVGCPAHLPVCEQRAADEGSFCYREALAGVARRRTPAGAGQRPALPVPASRSYRLIEQSVAKMEGTTLAAGR
mgnify:FL=1